MVVRFIQARPGVHSGLLGSLRRIHGDVGCIPVRLVHSRASWGSSGSFGLFGSRPGGRWVHLGALDSFGSALGVVGFIGACP